MPAVRRTRQDPNEAAGLLASGAIVWHASYSAFSSTTSKTPTACGSLSDAAMRASRIARAAAAGSPGRAPICFTATSRPSTVSRARHYGAIAKDALALFPAAPMKQALEEAVEFCTARTH